MDEVVPDHPEIVDGGEWSVPAPQPPAHTASEAGLVPELASPVCSPPLY
jgi:hypothetical protein